MTIVRKTNFRLIACLSAAVVCAPAIAFAQDAQPGQAGAQAQEGEAESTGPSTGATTTLGTGTPAGALPPPRSDDDPLPPPPAPTVATGGLTEQAGVGGDQAYGRAGVLELGGFANLTSATNYFAIGFSPTIGYFFMDNFQLSAIINITHASVTTEVNNVEEDQSTTQLMLLAEPSVHLPFTPTLYGFLGVGFGLASQSVDPGPSAGAGFAIAPRLGINVLIGRSGILTPALQGVYQTTDAIQTPQGTVVAVSSSFGLQVGYTVMW